MKNNVILSNYFTTKNDPQRNFTWDNDCYSNIAEWVESIVKFNLKGIIFHDCLSNEFIKKYGNENIEFIYYELKTNLCINDERFICWYEHLKKNKYDNVFVTDLFDVSFNKNPFDLVTDSYKIYAGAVYHPDKIRTVCDSPIWTIPMKRIYGELHYCDKKLINAGVIGGKQSDTLNLFAAMIQDFKTYDYEDSVNHIWEGDTPVFNKNLYDLFDESEMLLGFPVTSKFKKFEEEGDFYIRHK